MSYFQISFFKKKIVVIITLLICLLGKFMFADRSLAWEQDTSTILQEASVLVRQEKVAEAKLVLEKAVEDGNHDKVIINTLVRVYNKLYQKYGKSKQLLLQVIEEQPEEWSFFQSLGKTLLYKEKAQEAINNLQKAVELYQPADITWDHALANLYYELANVYIQVGETGQAIDSLEKTVQNDPFHLQGSNLLHRLYVKNEDYEKAYRVWRANYQVFPGQQDLKGFQKWDELSCPVYQLNRSVNWLGRSF